MFSNELPNRFYFVVRLGTTMGRTKIGTAPACSYEGGVSLTVCWPGLGQVQLFDSNQRVGRVLDF